MFLQTKNSTENATQSVLFYKKNKCKREENKNINNLNILFSLSFSFHYPFQTFLFQRK